MNKPDRNLFFLFVSSRGKIEAFSTYAGKVCTRESCYQGVVGVAYVHVEYRILPFGQRKSDAYSIRKKEKSKMKKMRGK
jgi:hypothetical protein